MHSARRTKSAVALAVGAMLCAACDEVGLPDAAWPRQPSLAVVAAPAQPDEFRACAAERAEVGVGKAAASDEPPECAVRLIVRVEAPADLPLEVSVAVLAEDPLRFRAYGCDPRLLDDELDEAWYRWDPRGRPPISDDDYRVEVRDGHVFVDVPLEDLPSGRELWLCVYSGWERGWSDYRAFPPRIERIAALDPADPPHVEHVRLHPRGGIVGRVVDHAPLPPREPMSDDDSECDGGEGDDSDEPSYLEVHDLGGVEFDEYFGDGDFALAPLTSGWHRLEIDAGSMRQYGFAYRRLTSTFVRDGAPTDMGTIEFGLEPPALRVHVVDEAGLAVDCALQVALGDGRSRTVWCNDSGDFALVGDWMDVERIEFAPGRGGEYEPASIAIDMGVDRERELVLRQRAVLPVRVEVIARAPDGTCAGEPGCLLRALGSASWVVVRTSRIGCGGGWCECEPLEPGSYEIAAWCGETHMSCRQVIEVAAPAPGETLHVELQCTDSRTMLSGELRTTYDGISHETWLEAAIAPAGSGDSEFRNHYDEMIRIDSGRFEIAGLPPGIPLELRIADDVDDSRIVFRRAFTLDASERLDLGVIDIDVR